MPESSPIPEADLSFYEHVQAAPVYFWQGDEARGRPPSLSEWFPWPREDGRFLIRTLIQGVSGLGPNCIKNPRIAPLFWQEMAVQLREGGKLDFPSWLAPMIAECFEKIANGEDCELSMGLKRTTGDRWISLRDLWARAAIIETIKAKQALSDHQATELFGKYLGLRNGSTLRKGVSSSFFTVGGSGDVDLYRDYKTVARSCLDRQQCIAKGPGMEDLAESAGPLRK